MICPRCLEEGVLNTVLGKDFYYCRTCKDEIRLSDVPMPPRSAGQYGSMYIPNVWRQTPQPAKHTGPTFTAADGTVTCSYVTCWCNQPRQTPAGQLNLKPKTVNPITFTVNGAKLHQGIYDLVTDSCDSLRCWCQLP